MPEPLSRCLIRAVCPARTTTADGPPIRRVAAGRGGSRSLVRRWRCADAQPGAKPPARREPRAVPQSSPGRRYSVPRTDTRRYRSGRGLHDGVLRRWLRFGLQLVLGAGPDCGGACGPMAVPRPRFHNSQGRSRDALRADSTHRVTLGIRQVDRSSMPCPPRVAESERCEMNRSFSFPRRRKRDEGAERTWT